jgi:hypothetical protein
MPNTNKNKGKNFERELAHHLTTVFGLNHERVWSSGAFTGGKNVFRTASLTPAQQLLTVGDIVVPESLSTYSYECKFYSEFSFNSLFTETGNAILDKWITQAKCPNRNWLLCYKINHMGSFVVYDINSPVPYTLNKPNENYMKYKGCIITKLEGFFEQNKDIMLEANKSFTQKLIA